MTKIHFYNTSPIDHSQLETLLAQASLPDTEIVYDQAALEAGNADPDAAVISVFIDSKVSAEVLAALPKLKLIVCRSTGFDNVDVAAANSRDIAVTNVPTYGENTVAEYAAGLLLALVRHLPASIASFATGHTDYERLRGTDLLGKTLGIIGAGRIGCHMSQIGNGFGMKVLSYDARQDPPRAQQYGFTYTPLNELLAAADFISLHVPLLPETRHMINAQTLALVKPGALLINTSRGEVVDTVALIEALQQGILAGAALDVFEGENLVDIDEELRALKVQATDQLILTQNLQVDILRHMPNVILTNHNAFNTVEAIQRINNTTVQTIANFLAGHTINQVPAPPA